MSNDLENRRMVMALTDYLNGAAKDSLGLVSARHRHFSTPSDTSLETRALALLAFYGFSLIEARDDAGRVWSIVLKPEPVLGLVDPRFFPDVVAPW